MSHEGEYPIEEYLVSAPMPLLEPGAWAKCCSCGFHVTRQNEVCPDCGAFYPFKADPYVSPVKPSEPDVTFSACPETAEAMAKGAEAAAKERRRIRSVMANISVCSWIGICTWMENKIEDVVQFMVDGAQLFVKVMAGCGGLAIFVFCLLLSARYPQLLAVMLIILAAVCASWGSRKYQDRLVWKRWKNRRLAEYLKAYAQWEKDVVRQRHLEALSKYCFQQREVEAKASLNACHTVIDKIERRIENMQADPKIPVSEYQHDIENAIEAVKPDMRKHELELLKVQLLRWQNRLFPLAAALKTDSIEECENYAAQCSEVEKSAHVLLEEWRLLSNPVFSPTSPYEDAEPEPCDVWPLIKSLEDGLKQCDKFYKLFNERILALELRDINSEPIRAIDFRVQQALYDFAEAAKESKNLNKF